MVEDLLLKHNLSVLNDGSYTCLHPATGSASAIDLSIATSFLYLDFSWQVITDQHGSEHFPVGIQGHSSATSVHNPTPAVYRSWEYSHSSALCRLFHPGNVVSVAVHPCPWCWIPFPAVSFLCIYRKTVTEIWTPYYFAAWLWNWKGGIERRDLVVCSPSLSSGSQNLKHMCNEMCTVFMR